jgi:hypothetical protein
MILVMLKDIQVEYVKASGCWRACGDELRCRIVADPDDTVELDMPVVAVDGRYFTVQDFVKLLAGQGRRGLRLVFTSEGS